MQREVRQTYRARGKRARRRARRQRLCRAGMYLAALAIVAAAVMMVLPRKSVPASAPAENAHGAPAPEPTPGGGEKFLVAVDPGHGGGDVGAEGLGFYEEEMTHRTAAELVELLEADGRFAAVLTHRPEDGILKPSQRAAVAKAAGVQLLISIHGNSDPVYDARGFECYPAPPGGEYHAESLRFGTLLAEGFSGAGEPLRGENGVRYLYYGANDEKLIFEASDETVHSDPSFTILEQCGCPAVLAEQCFITNSDDVAALAGESGCRAAAQIYYEAICAWYEGRPS